MAKKDVFDFCVDSLGRSRQTAPTDYKTRSKIYDDCKAFAAQNGYTAQTFSQIWDAAIDERNRIDGLHFTPSAKYTK